MSEMKSNISHILSIIFTTIFLIGSSFLWYRAHNNYQMINNYLDKDTKVFALNQALLIDDECYAFSITSNYYEDKEYSIELIGLDNEEYDLDILDNESLGLIHPHETHIYKVLVMTDDYNNEDVKIVVSFK